MRGFLSLRTARGELNAPGYARMQVDIEVDRERLTVRCAEEVSFSRALSEWGHIVGIGVHNEAQELLFVKPTSLYVMTWDRVTVGHDP